MTRAVPVTDVSGRMRNMLGRGELPADVREALGVVAGERVLASAATDVGGYLVGTDKAAYVPGPDGYERIGWERVERADWSDSMLRLRVLGEKETRSYPVDRAGRLPEVVQERVTASIVVNERVLLDGSRGVRVMARRRPDSAEPVWSLVFDQGLDPTDPAVRRAAEDALGLIRDQTGV